MSQPTADRKAQLLRVAEAWEKLAAEQPGDTCGHNRATQYRKTAKSARMEAEDGIARCACCLLPYGRKNS